MLRLTVILGTIIVLSTGGASSSNFTQKSETSNSQINKNATNSFGDVLGVLSKLLGTGTSQNAAGLVHVLEGLIQGAGSKGNLPNGWMPGNKTIGNGDIMSLLARLAPLLSQTGITDPTKLLPVALGYLTSSINSLAMKGVSETCRNDLQMWITGLAQFKGWAWKSE